MIGDNHDSADPLGTSRVGRLFCQRDHAITQQEATRGAEYITERAAEMADEMLLERRERCAERRSASVDWIGPAKGQ